MIGQHPELYGFPELKLFAYDTLAELADSLPQHQRTAEVAHRGPGLVRAVAQLEFGDQSPQAIQAALAWLERRSDWCGADVFDRLMQYVHPRIAVEKSPEHATNPDALQRLAAAYPRARYIHLTRHPVTCAESMRRHLMRGSAGPDKDLAVFCAYVWYEVNFRLQEFGRKLSTQCYVRLRAEDVLNDPRRTLRSLMLQLGLRADQAAIEAMLHPERSVYAQPGPADSGAVGGNDREFLLDPRPRPAVLPPVVQRPSDLEAPEVLWSAVLELSAELGYAGQETDAAAAG